MKKVIMIMLCGIIIFNCGGEDQITASVDTDTDTDTDADTDRDLKNMWECLICGEEDE